MTSLREKFIQAAQTGLNAQIKKFVEELPQIIEDNTAKASRGEQTLFRAPITFANKPDPVTLRKLDAYIALHEFCAHPDVDMKIDYDKRSGVLSVDFEETYRQTSPDFKPAPRATAEKPAAPQAPAPAAKS